MPRKGHKIPYGTFSDEQTDVRNAYYYYGYRKDEDMPPLPELAPDDEVEDPEEVLHKKQLYQALDQFLSELTPREQRILRMRFGFGCPPCEPSEIAASYDVSTTRIRQIEMHAMDKMRQPMRIKTLKLFFNPDSADDKLRRFRRRYLEIQQRAAAAQAKKEQREKQLREYRAIPPHQWVYVEKIPPHLKHLKETNPKLFDRIKAIAFQFHQTVYE